MTTPPPRRGPVVVLGQSGLMLGRNLALMRANPATIMGAAVFPLIFLFGFFAVLQRSVERLGVDYAQYLPPIVTIQAMFFTGISSAYALADDRARLMMERFRSLPIGRWVPIVGRVGADGVRAMLSLVVVTTASMLLGFRFEAGAPAALGYVVVVLLFALVAAAGCGVVGLRAKSAEAASSTLFLPYLPLLMLSSGFVPVAGFPGWIQPFVRWQPVSLTADALRALSSGGPTAGPVVKCLVALGALLLLFGALAARAFRKESS